MANANEHLNPLEMLLNIFKTVETVNNRDNEKQDEPDVEPEKYDREKQLENERDYYQRHFRNACSVNIELRKALEASKTNAPVDNETEAALKTQVASCEYEIETLNKRIRKLDKKVARRNKLLSDIINAHFSVMEFLGCMVEADKMAFEETFGDRLDKVGVKKTVTDSDQ